MGQRMSPNRERPPAGPEEYDPQANAALGERLKQTHEVSASDNSTFASMEPGNEQVCGEPKSITVGTALRILAVLVWTALPTFRLQGFSAGTVGYWIGILFIPFLIAYAITRRERNWTSFSYWFLGIGIVLSSAALPKNLTSLSHSDMVKELIGTKPLESNLPENQKEMAIVTRAYFADLRTFRAAQDAKLKSLTPDLAQVYSNESFSSRASIQKSLDAVDKMWDVGPRKLSIHGTNT
jgi:hypothetical protein